MPPSNKPKAMKAMAKTNKKESWKSIKRLLKLVLKDYGVQFFFMIICVLVSSGASVAGSYFIGNVLVDDLLDPYVKSVQSGLSVEFDYSRLGFVILVMGLIYLAGMLCTYSYNILMTYIGQGSMKKVRDDLFDHMQTLPISYFDRRGHGDIMSVYTNDVDTLREMISRVLPMVVSSFTTMVVCLVVMLISDIMLTGIVILFAILMFVLTKYCTGKASRFFIRQQEELGATNAYIEELTNGQKVVKVFNYEQRNIAGFKEHNEAFFEYSVKANRFSSILMPMVNQLGNIQYVIVAFIGALGIINSWQTPSLMGIHYMSVGIIVSFLMYSKAFIQPIGQISQQLNIIALGIAGASRIFEVMDEPSEIDNGYVELVFAKADENGNPVESEERTGRWAWKHPHQDGSGVDYKWLEGDVVLEDVDFAYIPGKTILHDMSIYARPGQKVAFVGPTGAGKTTITNLITRFYDIEDGKVRLDGININKIKKADLRRCFGMVLQDTKLFTGTIKENIRFGNLNATDEEIYKAAKLANADSFIQNLPQGYDTMLKNGGASLSQGQRQLISIARAAVADPPVMILDEATSSIDSRTEALVQKGMDAIMKGRTVFVIAHRLSTIQNSDVIMVIDAGRIIERGSHDELLAKKGKYYQLYTGNAIAE